MAQQRDTRETPCSKNAHLLSQDDELECPSADGQGLVAGTHRYAIHDDPRRTRGTERGRTPMTRPEGRGHEQETVLEGQSHLDLLPLVQSPRGNTTDGNGTRRQHTPHAGWRRGMCGHSTRHTGCRGLCERRASADPSSNTQHGGAEWRGESGLDVATHHELKRGQIIHISSCH